MILDRVSRDEETKRLISLGLVQAWGTPPAEASDDIGIEIATHVEQLRRLHGGKSAGEIESLRPARSLYHALGIDPTRHRPSPEALLRRLLRGDEFPRVHPAVDLANLWALLSGLPVGLYDVDKIRPEGPLTVRRGRSGESYPGIRKPEIQLEGALVIADVDGPFGNPSADSLRSSVTESTHDFWFVLFVPVDVNIQAIDGWVAWLRERAEAYLAARAVSAVLP